MTKLYFEMNAYDINIRIPDEGRPPLTPMIFAHEFSKDGVVMQNESVKVTAALVIILQLNLLLPIVLIRQIGRLSFQGIPLLGIT